MKEINIRWATSEDSALILHFIRELAIYEKAENEVVTTEEEITETLFGERSKTKALLCFVDGVPAGFAVFFYSYSTWLGKNGIYLEDLFVLPKFRGCGAGKALLKKIAAIAVNEGCGRFEWSVLDWNTPAIDFYESIGARPQSEWIRYRLEGEPLIEFGQE